MNLSLQSRTMTVAWAQLFRILAFKLCVPFWDLLNVPRQMQENPHHLLKISKFFLSGDRSILLDHELSSKKEVENYYEASRMLDLGHLYACFGRLVAFYGDRATRELYEFGQCHFVDEQSRLWNYWDVLFSHLRTDRSWITRPPREGFVNHLLGILTDRFQELTHKQEALLVIWGQFCEAYSSDLESQRNNLSEMLGYDIRNSEFTNEVGFDSPCDELAWVFNFDSLIENECSVNIWRDINRAFERRFSSEFFDLCVRRIAAIDQNVSQKIERLKDNYLSLS